MNDSKAAEAIEAEAKATAHALIPGYIGPDHRVLDMGSFYRAIVQALQAAHQKGWTDRADADSSATKH